MDKLWRLLVANFILLAAIVMVLMCYVFEGTIIAWICLYGMLICIPWGLIKGIYVIIDYHKEHKDEE